MSQRMKAVWIEAGSVRLRDDVLIPAPQPGQALVQVLQAGICGTDLALRDGYAGFSGIPGHEFCGRIVDCPGNPEQEGQRVVGEINIGCGRCDHCRAGLRNHCSRRRVLGIRDWPGAFAEFLLLPEANLNPVPESISDRAAVFAEPLAAAIRITRQLDLNRFGSVLVVGAGRLGQLIARVLANSGRPPWVVARHARHRDLLHGWAANVVSEAELTGRQYDLVVEATGSPSGLQTAVSAVRPEGTIVLKSTLPGPARTDLSAVVVNEIHLLGSRCGPIRPALIELERGLEVEPLIDLVLPLERAEEGFQNASQPGALKVLLGPAGEQPPSNPGRC